MVLQQLQLGLVPYIEALNLFDLRNDSEMVKEMDLLLRTAGSAKGHQADPKWIPPLAPLAESWERSTQITEIQR